MKILLTLIIMILAITGNSFAQTSVQELEAYFDFWVGEWELSWTDNQGKEGAGTNTIERILDGVVIQENFMATEGALEGYKGRSVSVYNPQRQSWHQAWVDNQGGYIDLKGSVDGNQRIFQTAERPGPQGGTIINRMVFYDINKDSFTWDWESSQDGGESWSLNWRIFYQRVK
ncbi:DUF1579 family protein [Gracilimonas sp. BCB1]|uniref:DUF1579 family protein n=1 Tax=Gracilimonas sp. BCB1 TaxID=3152362 RepID=UPI0032D927E9